MSRKDIYPALPVVIIDDEAESLQSSQLTLMSGGIHNIITLQDGRELAALLEQKDIGVILLDLVMPRISGQDILKHVSQDYPHIPVIIVTGMNEVETAVDCMRLGAFDYMVKPVEKSRMVSGVRRAVELQELRQEYNILSRSMMSDTLQHPEAFFSIVTNSPRMRSVFHYCEAVAGTGKPVLITGETGVGKELLARAIHELSGHKGPFVAVNVAGLDDNVISDTLFGHVRGAFTGADAVRHGLIEKAAGGTLFLDEIGDLGTASQVKLLRLLQEREYLPLGSDVAKKTDARIIASTNQNLAALQKEGRFRRDLFFRLRTHHIDIPPLRERFGDIPLLVDYFIARFCESLAKPRPSVPRELHTLLGVYSFPGNVRELEAMIFDAVSNHPGGPMSLKVFKRHIMTESPAVSTPSSGDALHETAVQIFMGCEPLPSIREAAELLIGEAMRRSSGNQTVAAQLLGITQSALNKRLRQKKPGDE